MQARDLFTRISVVLFFSLFSLSYSVNAWAAEIPLECIEEAEHNAVTFLLIDRSDKLENVQALEQTLQRVRKMIEYGERLVVGFSTDKASEARVILDITKPKKSVWVSTLKIRAAEKKFTECFKKMETLVKEQSESYKASAILETLSFVSKVLIADKAESKRVVMFSDMVQNSSSVSFYGMKNVDPEAGIKKAEKEYLIFDFKGVDFYVAGAGIGVSDKKARAIEQFWKRYIEKTGGTLRFYGPVLLTSS